MNSLQLERLEFQTFMFFFFLFEVVSCFFWGGGVGGVFVFPSLCELGGGRGRDVRCVGSDVVGTVQR